MLNPKFIENNEDVVILTKSEYEKLLSELSDYKEKAHVFSDAFNDAYSQIEKKDGAATFSNFKKERGWSD
ncbi:hypothetical protein [Pseudolactococcus insecticola]|uniref:Uncharacterized protein n=1 Tax=Pseudolactococcus insecticola TaxID=2709158 RepID=A0A6A0B784_9LACT|nr:hypothetical protein [Lactococcus insecticola]GFH40806.1 hypothetical protein Hs20B_12040 [Lactococcus insecticola]